MKIVLVINSFPEISETFIVRQTIKLEAEVICLTSNDQNLEKYSLDKSHIHELSKKRKPSISKKIFSRLKGVPFRIWSSKEKKKFEKLLITLDIDMVLACFGPNGINVMESCLKLKIPYVVQFLGYDASSLLNNKWYKQNIAQVIKKSKAVIVLYHGMEIPFVDLGAKKEKFEVINIGVPIDKFAQIKPDYSKKGTTNFIAVGRLVEKKSPINVLKSFLICAAQNPNVKLNIVGDGELKDKVNRFISENRILSDKVILHGFLSQNELRKLYLQQHIFVQHSLTASDGNKEGWPVGVAEACASGMPVIATRHAGICDQIIHEVTGYLVDEGDYTSMGNYMYKLSLNWDLAKKMGEKSRKYIDEQGNLDQQILKLKALLGKN